MTIAEKFPPVRLFCAKNPIQTDGSLAPSKGQAGAGEQVRSDLADFQVLTSDMTVTIALHSRVAANTDQNSTRVDESEMRRKCGWAEPTTERSVA